MPVQEMQGGASTVLLRMICCRGCHDHHYS
jgi:hypothetical protein